MAKMLMSIMFAVAVVQLVAAAPTHTTDEAIEFAVSKVKEENAGKPVEVQGAAVSNPLAPKWTVQLKVDGKDCTVSLEQNDEGNLFVVKKDDQTCHS